MATSKQTTVKPQAPFYRVLRPLTVADKQYKPGDVIPEAMSWPRVDAWVRARKIEFVEAS